MLLATSIHSSFGSTGWMPAANWFLVHLHVQGSGSADSCSLQSDSDGSTSGEYRCQTSSASPCNFAQHFAACAIHPVPMLIQYKRSRPRISLRSAAEKHIIMLLVHLHVRMQGQMRARGCTRSARCGQGAAELVGVQRQPSEAEEGAAAAPPRWYRPCDAPAPHPHLRP